MVKGSSVNGMEILDPTIYLGGNFSKRNCYRKESQIAEDFKYLPKTFLHRIFLGSFKINFQVVFRLVLLPGEVISQTTTGSMCLGNRFFLLNNWM